MLAIPSILGSFRLNEPFLLDPLIYAFILASIYAIFSKFGYTRSAEAIYGTIQSCFGRKAHRDFMASWRGLKAAKAEVARVSAQDEFAKWAKLQRKVDTLQADFDQKHSSRQKSLLFVQWAGSLALQIATAVSAVAFVYFNRSQPALNLSLLQADWETRLPKPVVNWLLLLLSFPKASKGSLSVIVWALMVKIAVKEALNAFIW